MKSLREMIELHERFESQMQAEYPRYKHVSCSEINWVSLSTGGLDDMERVKEQLNINLTCLRDLYPSCKGDEAEAVAILGAYQHRLFEDVVEITRFIADYLASNPVLQMPFPF